MSLEQGRLTSALSSAPALAKPHACTRTGGLPGSRSQRSIFRHERVRDFDADFTVVADCTRVQRQKGVFTYVLR
jgi:hypothetical protein